MTYPAYCLKLNQKDLSFEAVRTVNNVVYRGVPVFRWQGPQTSFAEPGDLIFSSTTSHGLPTAELVELPESQFEHLTPLKPGRVALLWDKSFQWGYLASDSLRDLGFSFDLLTAEGVRNGALDGYHLLVVPGGWASLKSEELQVEGRDRLRRFVKNGGGYLGLCGGAGLALQVDEGLSLLPVTRKPMADRLPNFSGSIRVSGTGSHPLWWGLQRDVTLQVWWPSQFELVEPAGVEVIGRYRLPEKDFCVSDLNVYETKAADLDWERLERDYQINLDPARLLDEPAIVGGNYGNGRVLLSYPHLETPGDAAGNLALFNVWYDLLATSCSGDGDDPRGAMPLTTFQVTKESMDRVRGVAREAEELIELGEQFQLWSRRNPWLLKWKRGIRGAEFGTICMLSQGLARELERTSGIAIDSTTGSLHNPEAQFKKLVEDWSRFFDRARALVEEEGRGMSGKGAETGTELSTRTRALRREIFNCVQCYGSKSYGGLYRQLLDQLDTLLMGALLAEANPVDNPIA